jgi:hypothetical protein
MPTGDDIEAGKITGAENTTFIVAQRDEDDDTDFNGDFVLIVGPAEGSYGNGVGMEPTHKMNGLLAIGEHGSYTVPDFTGGFGVIGQGGRRQGTGVLGLGGGADRNGEGIGGFGVHGVGGRGHKEVTWPADEHQPPGVGVLAQGGRQNERMNTDRRAHGAGLVAVAGGAEGRIPTFDETGGVGVFAVGGDAETHEVPTPEGGTEKAGPSDPGAGVLGFGGRADDGRIGPGVVGLSGNATGAQPEGVGVVGDGHIGVLAHGDRDRGGMFSSDHKAQIQLVPRPANLPAPVPVSTTALDMREFASVLPKNGRAGDLLTLFDRETQVARLWFCVKTADRDDAALWQEVLLGPEFNGRGED